MHPNLVTLYNLQLADTHIRNNTRKIEALDWGEVHQKAIKALRMSAAAMAAEKANTDKALAQAEKNLAEIEARIKRSEKRLGGAEIHNLHEMQSVEKELETSRARRQELEEEVLGLMEQAEKFPDEASALRNKEQFLVRELTETKQRSTLEKEKLEQDIAAVTVRRDALAAELPPTLLKRYDQMRQNHGGIAVVRIVNNTCDACHVAVPNVLVKQVLESPDLIPCQDCGRYLYTDRDWYA